MRQQYGLKVYREPIKYMLEGDTHYREPDKSKDLFPLYAKVRNQEDIHHIGKRLPKGYGHTGETINYDEEKALEDIPADVTRGVSGIGVNWDADSKEKRLEDLKDSIHMFRRGSKLVGGHAKSWKTPALKDSHEEVLLTEFKPEEILADSDKVFDKKRSDYGELATAIHTRQGARNMLKEGFKPYTIQSLRETLDEPEYTMGSRAKSNREYELYNAMNRQADDYIANDMVNRRPTRTASDTRLKNIVKSLQGHVY